MIFADKIIKLRKKSGWSQEELADKMNTSRQAISKWESAQSIPDISKILQLGQLFGVTTDYLLKDEIEDEEFSDDENDLSVKKISLQEACEYLDQRKISSYKIALASFLCVLAPIPLIILGAASEMPQFNISENLAGGIGLIWLLIEVAIAVAIFIFCGYKNSPYEYLDKEPFLNEYGVTGMVKERQKEFRPSSIKYNTSATVLCILSPIALFIGAFTGNDFLTVVMLGITMLIAGIGAVLFIIAGVQNASMNRLLKEGDFNKHTKKANAKKEAISTVYWLVCVTVFLAVSFLTESWDKSWIIWPVAGVLYAALMAVCNIVLAGKEDK